MIPMLTDTIHQLENELLQPEIRKSTQRISQLLADDFKEIGSKGQIYNKQDILDHLPLEKDITWTMEDFEAREVDQSTALAIYKAKKASAAGTETSWRSSLWNKKSGQWQMVFHQGTMTS